MMAGRGDGQPGDISCSRSRCFADASAVSGSGDQGADPNKLVAIIDPLTATTRAARESFRAVRAAGFGEVLRGVSFIPER